MENFYIFTFLLITISLLISLSTTTKDTYQKKYTVAYYQSNNNLKEIGINNIL